MKFFNKSKKQSKSLLFELPSNSRYAESFRTLRTNLNFSSMEKGLRSVLVTSSVESEGKTTTAINLGYTMVQAGKKVLLIDADLRRPRLSGLFSLRKSEGFTDIISSTFSEQISKGNLRDYSMGDLLQLIKLQKRTGELHIESTNKIGIYFIDGKVIDVYWKNRPEEKKLANSLIRKSLITKEEAVLALGQQKKSVQRLGTILLTMGLVSKAKLSKELAVHTVEVMRIISGLIDGDFSFHPLSKSEINPPISKNINFDKLFKEFLSQGEALLFINKSIEAAIHTTTIDNLYVLPS
ncbi:MAG: DUF4388 domain-containing protein, partial [Desulfobacteraceae bacterium]|nr:DUF4388 domain-containing protein [Desulfobacteraceae bacterium]